MGEEPSDIEGVLEVNYEDIGRYIEQENESLDLEYTSSSRLEEMKIIGSLKYHLEPSDILIETGCSYGHTTETLQSELDATVIGFDYFDRWNEYSFIDNKSPQKIQAMEPLLPFKDNSVNFVLALNSTGVVAQENMIGKLGEELIQENSSDKIHKEASKIYTQNYIEAALEEVSRVLKDKGSYMVSNHLGFLSEPQRILMTNKDGELILEDINQEVVSDRDIKWLSSEKVKVPQDGLIEKLEQ